MQRQEVDNPVFPSLPEEISMAILAKLSTAQLYDMAQVSLDSYRLAKEDYWLREIAFYKECARQSILWQHLAAIADSDAKPEKLTEALQGMLGDEVPQFLSQFDSLASLIKHANQLPWLAKKPIVYSRLQQIAQMLREYLCDANPLQSSLDLSHQKHFLALMNSPRVGHEKKMLAWRSYYQLDRQLTFAVFSILLSQVRHQADLLSLLNNPLLMNLILGKDLVAIDASSPQNLIGSLIDRVLQLNAKEAKTNEELSGLAIMTSALNRLTGKDLVAFYQTEGFRDRLETFKKLFQNNNSLLIDKFSEQNLLAMLSFKPENVLDLPMACINNHPLADSILNNAALLRKFSSQGLVTVLDKLATDHPESIANYPALDVYLNYELLQQWIDNNELYKSDKTIAVLTNKKYLMRLNDAQIALITQSLPGLYSSKVLKNTGFIDRVKVAVQPNHLLLKIATFNPHDLLYDIAKNNTLVKMLEAEDVLNFCQLTSLAAPLLVANDAVTRKLSSAQLLTILGIGAETSLVAVETGCFTRLSDDDFTAFLRKTLGGSHYTDQMLETLCAEVVKRLPQLSSSSHQLPPLLAVLQNKCSRYKRLEKHFGALLNAFRSKQIFHAALRQTNQEKVPERHQEQDSMYEWPGLESALTRELAHLSAIHQSQLDKKSTNWGRVAKIAGLAVLALTGIALLATGIGAAGVPFLASAASLMFGWLAVSPFVPAIAIGGLATVFSLAAGVVEFVEGGQSKNKAFASADITREDKLTTSYDFLYEKAPFQRSSVKEEPLYASTQSDLAVQSKSLAVGQSPERENFGTVESSVSRRTY